MNGIKRLCLFAVIIMAVACSDSRIYDKIISFDEDVWSADAIEQFEVAVNDTTLAYDILVHIRNSGDYQYSNLWMFVETKAPGGAVMRDTVEYILADEAGVWLGKGISSVKSMMVPYKLNVRFPYRGIYTFAFQQGMRDEELVGIKNIGLRIQERE